jgi:hypothetical protein
MSKHVEFPELTPKARAAHDAAINAIQSITVTISPNDFCRALAAFLQEALVQAELPLTKRWSDVSQIGKLRWSHGSHIDKLFAIADNLHSPPPPAPTLAEAQAADLDTQEGIETVRAFLATLEEGGQVPQYASTELRLFPPSPPPTDHA